MSITDFAWKAMPMAIVLAARPLLEAEHEEFRNSFRSFIERTLGPRYAEFEQAQCVDREIWLEAGKMGFLCPEVSESYGGAGTGDFRFNAVLVEELNARSMRGFGLSVHSDIVVPYLLRLGTEEQKRRWLPKMVN